MRCLDELHWWGLVAYSEVDDGSYKQWRSHKFFLMVSCFLWIPRFIVTRSRTFLDRFGSSRVKSRNKSKCHSKNTMSLN
ncbi:hypothetical protein HanPSC8_Chr16g0706311 [Helianthus annuus]|nr:hypothetical protein HanPSC8_Chr16g0706311 [Helianthus annuus]